MKIKPLLCLVLFLFCHLLVNAQSFSKAVFRVSEYNGGYAVIELTVDNIMLTMDINGNILSFSPLPVECYDCPGHGHEVNSRPGGFFDIEYYTNDYVGKRDGKPKSVGDIKFDYYTNDYVKKRDGKVKSIGGIEFDYYTNDYVGKRDGKLKSIGGIDIDYYTNDYVNKIDSKIKSIGEIKIDYWSKDYTGNRSNRVKSITGNTSFLYAY